MEAAVAALVSEGEMTEPTAFAAAIGRKRSSNCSVGRPVASV